MSLSGWVAIGCWAILAVLIFGAAAVMVWRDRHRLSEPDLLDFRDWLDDWDEVWR
jgi:uncharacterized protein HemX